MKRLGTANFGASFFPEMSAKTLLILTIYVFALILPIGGTIALRYLSLLVILVCFTITSVRAKKRPEFPLLLPWLLYLAAALLSLSHAVDVNYSLREIKNELIIPFLIFVVAANVITTHRELRQFLGVVLFGFVVLVCYNILVAVSGGTTKDGLIGSINSGVGTFSTYLILTMPLPLYFIFSAEPGRQKKYLAPMMALLIAGFSSALITQNRQAVLALLIEFFVVFFGLRRGKLTRPKLIAFCVVTALIFGLVIYALHARAKILNLDLIGSLLADPRLQAWHMFLQQSVNAPWSGVGFGLRSFAIAYPDIPPPHWHIHNVILNKYAQMGFVGVASFLLLYGWLLKKLRPKPGQDGATHVALTLGTAVALGMLVKNMTDDFFTRELGYLFWLIEGAIIGVLYAGDTERDPTGDTAPATR